MDHDTYLADRWLWLSLGVLICFAASGIRHAIQDTIQLTELDPHPSVKKKESEKSPEDSISVDTLRTLASSPNLNISHAAKSLVASRFAQDDELMQTTFQHVFAADETVRRQACHAVEFLRDQAVPIPRPIEMALRPGSASSMIPRRMRASDRAAAEAEVSNAAADAATDRDVFHGMPLLARITDLAPEPSPEPSGYLQLFTEPSTNYRYFNESPSDGSYGAFGSARFAGWENVPNQRPPASNSPEEVERRRRRREAMVFHEGEGVVDENDIIRPSR